MRASVWVGEGMDPEWVAEDSFCSRYFYRAKPQGSFIFMQVYALNKVRNDISINNLQKETTIHIEMNWTNDPVYRKTKWEVISKYAICK